MPELDKKTFTLELGNINSKFDDDDCLKRIGTLMTASAHIITVVIGSGALSLAWALAQLSWIVGPLGLLTCSLITWFTSTLLSDAYRSPLTATRNYTYMDAVKNNLGGMSHKFCCASQFGYLTGSTIGYLLTASISMAAIKRSNCFHKNGHEAGCHTSNNMYMIIFGVTQIILSQIPNFHNLSELSIIAAVMSFAYSFIGLGLAIAKIAGGNYGQTSIAGVRIGVDVTFAQKIWSSLLAIGNIAFAYAYSSILIEIQLSAGYTEIKPTREPSDEEGQLYWSLGHHSILHALWNFWLCCFRKQCAWQPLNRIQILRLVDLANLCIVIHLVGAYQVYSQPTFALVENWCNHRWLESEFVRKGYAVTIPFCGTYNLNMFRLIWRTLCVLVTTVIAMMFPFFNNVLALLGAISFWPLTVYFPIEMYISRAQIRRFSLVWIWLKVLIGVCLVVSLLATVSSIEGLYIDVRAYKPFNSIS